jgi:hypothetical protein
MDMVFPHNSMVEPASVGIGTHGVKRAMSKCQPSAPLNDETTVDSCFGQNNTVISQNTYLEFK